MMDGFQVVAANDMPGRVLPQNGGLLPAYAGGIAAAGGEAASRLRVDRGGQLALQGNEILFMVHVRNGDRRQQRLGVGVQRIGNSVSLSAFSTISPRYITMISSEM